MGKWSLFLAVMLWLVGGISSSSTTEAQEVKSVATPATLSPGEQAGTFVFSFSGRIKFTQEDAFPVHVILSTEGQTPVADIVVKNAGTFTIAANLVPGGYQIQSEMLSGKDAAYWDAVGPRFFINSSGGIRYVPTDDSLVHKKKLPILTPNPQHLTTTNRDNMLVRWAPLRGAERYHISWSEQELPHRTRIDTGSGDTRETEFPFQDAVHMNRRYEFSIYAFDSTGRVLGYSAPMYFYTVGAQKVTEPKVASTSSSRSTPQSKPADPEERPAAPKPAVPFFGVRPVPVPGGIRVAGIGAQTPARKAGLQLDDIITNFNGTALAEVKSAEEFTKLVQMLPPGTRVIVEYYRKNERLVTEAVIEARR